MSCTNISQLLLLLSLLTLSLQINQTCQPDPVSNSCPANSFCNSQGYCECNDGWVLDCSVPSLTLTQNFQQLELTKQKPLILTVVPTSDDAIFVYRFEMCLNEGQAKLNMALYADEGAQSQLNKDNLIGQRNDFRSLEQCWPIFSPYMQFGTQANGKIEQMILRIETVELFEFQGILSSLFPKNAVTNTDKTNKKLSVRVFEIFFLYKQTLWIIVIAFFSFIGFSFVAGVVFCIYTIRRGSKRFLDNNLKHFQKLLPKIKIKANDQFLGQVCPVCLLEFATGDNARKTPCGHIFHCQCLDIWCKKNLSCPVCRSNLSKKHLEDQLKNQGECNLTTCSSRASSDIQNLNQALREDAHTNLREPLKQNQSL